MPLTPTFCQRVQSLYRATMGTETAAELLYSLIRFARPQRLIEIGAGYTTLFILQALADNVSCWRREARAVKNVTSDESVEIAGLLLADYYMTAYSPCLVAIDDLSHPKTAAPDVQTVAKELGLSQYLKWFSSDFATLLPSLRPESGPFDLAWLDCGSYKNYATFIRTLWPLMNEDGGLFLVHSTETNLEGQNFIHHMKLRQATTDFRNFELCSLLEPHKLRQNSIAIFRITKLLRERCYSLRA